MSRPAPAPADAYPAEPLACRCGPGRIELFKRGLRSYQKVSYPARVGLYHQLETGEALLHFNLNHEIIRLAGRGRGWPHPQEWLKRTAGNDWIYYSTGGYTGVFETTGEYYLPNLPYATNNHLGGKPLQDPAVGGLIRSWPALIDQLCRQSGCPETAVQALREIGAVTPAVLEQRAERLHQIGGGPVTVLPPDTRHLDYQVIPLAIASGCLYKCGFCRVKNRHPFRQLSLAEIEKQLEQLTRLYAADLINYNGIFLGQHDALNCEPRLIRAAIELAWRRLGLAESYVEGRHTFLFGSVDSLRAAETALFKDLDQMGGRTWINIGLESAHQPTLDRLGKPLAAAEVIDAFARIQDLNERFRTIEISANFVTDPDLPEGHYQALLQLLRESLASPKEKGCIYLSPLRFDDPSRARLFDFYRLKRLSRRPLFMYTIQRL